MLWDKRRLVIHASKTQRYRKKGIRIIPIFPRVEPHLRAVYDAAKVGDIYVITNYRDVIRANLRTNVIRLIKQAGVTPWGKPFQNLRASCQTDLAKLYPAHIVCAWMGNSERIAGDHYLQVTDADFEKAVEVTENELHLTKTDETFTF